MKEEDQVIALAITKIISMVVMFAMIVVTGHIPMKSQSFNQNPKLISLSSAFSGGLFIAVGLIHLLPEAVQKFDLYFVEHHIESKPYSQALCLMTFTLFLYIEKLAFSDVHQRSSLGTEEVVHNTSSLSPFILQIAIGIHAIFEGLAIGIDENISDCLGIALAVICHKWAEGLTLGVAFKKAGTESKKASFMIIFQALMNPIGVVVGWLLSSQASMITAAFVSISAGTFIYISTIEVIHEEFSIRRFQKDKFIMYMLGIIFICLIWFLEALLE